MWGILIKRLFGRCVLDRNIVPFHTASLCDGPIRKLRQYARNVRHLSKFAYIGLPREQSRWAGATFLDGSCYWLLIAYIISILADNGLNLAPKLVGRLTKFTK
jgi:hypothetical protein